MKSKSRNDYSKSGMVNIYIDESGDLGFRKGGSRYFILAGMVITDEETLLSIKRLFKKLRQRKLKKRLKQLPEFKAAATPEYLRLFILEKLRELPIKTYSLVLDKSTLSKVEKSQPELLYNTIVGRVILNILINTPPVEINIILDKRATKPKLREALNTHIRKSIDFYSNQKNDPSLNVRISHISSHTSAQLQAVDFIVWSILRYYQLNDSKYLDTIRPRIVLLK